MTDLHKIKDKPRKYYVVWRNKNNEVKEFRTDDGDAAFMMETRRKGTTYEDTRHAARLRLFYYKLRKQLWG